MTPRFGFLCAALMIGMVGFAPLGGSADPLVPSHGVARLNTYTATDGENYFALSLKPDVDDSSSRTTDLVVLIDTSASQVGEYQTAALSALQRLLEKLGETDTVKLIAIDLDATPLTPSFVSPDSAEMVAALAKLSRRVPLGSTDMNKAIQTALDSFGEPGPSQRAIVYIGDGRSAAKMIAPDTFRSLVVGCVKKQLPVTSYAIGPSTNPLFLAALANQTGGRVLVDGPEITPDLAAEHLAAAVEAVVVWPESVQWPQGVAAYPSPLQPLRTDRDNIVVGKGTNVANSKIALNGLVNDKTLKFQFDLPASRSDTANSYLVKFVAEVARNKGLTLPALGTSGLGKLRESIARDVDNLNRLATTAVAANDHEAAGRLADRAHQLDPEDPDASILTDQVKQDSHDAVTGRGRALSGDDHNLLDNFIEESGEGIDKVRDRQQVVTDAVKADVAHELEDANRMLDGAPETAEENLKLMLDSIRDVPDLDPDVRLQLENELKSAIRLAGTRKIESEREEREKAEVLAQKLARQRRVTDLEREQQKISQLMARFDSLMKEDRYLEAEETVLVAEQESKKTAILADPAITGASLNSHTKMMHDEYLATIQEQNRMMARTYLDVQKAAIPMPGDTPIVYPNAEIWEELTLRRQQYSAVDLQVKSEAEKKILKQLNEETRLEFPDGERLDLVLEQLSADHGIQIQLDPRALDDIGITSDTEVQIEVTGITLRSVLKLMLRKIDPELTYTIQDEVLLITTKESATENLTTKVYPVADLVLPIALSTQSGVGGFGSNMAGGMMGFGGMGGGQSAGMGGMGGGGMFSDQRLKTAIEPIGMSPSGITIYRFRYRGDPRHYRGVMAQELRRTHPEAVVVMPNGFYGVLYKLIDVDFIELPIDRTSLARP